MLARRFKLSSVQNKARLFSSKPDIVNVSLEEENPDVKDFFNYTWGRWLVDDAKERQARQTKFSLKGLVDVVKESVGAATKAPSNAEIEVKTITPHHEGKHHKIYRVDLSDGRSYALRIPYALGHAEYRQARMKSEVATMDFLKTKHGLAMPDVISWNSSGNNPVENEYMLSPFIEGDLLMKSWNPAELDIKSKSTTIKPLVDSMEKIVATKFNKFGSLYFTEDVSSSLQNDLPYADESDPNLADRWRIGPTTESRFWKGANAQVGAPYRGPFSTVQEYLDATAQVQLAYHTESNDPKVHEIFQRYAKIVGNLFQEPEVESVFSPRLHHPDLSPMNVLVNGDESFLLDYENTAIRPFALHGPPRFVLHKGPKIFTKEDIPDYEKLSEADRRAVDHFMAQTQNQFAFEYLFRQLNISQELFPAFLPGLKRRQAVVDTALQSTAATAQDLSYDCAMLSQEWQYLGTEQEFPAPYSEQELEQVTKDTDEWNQQIMANPFIETKGWVPADTFDQLVEQGILVKHGEHEYKYSGN